MIRKLRADEIECRVSQITASGCSLLLYKTARVDRAILDEMFGFRWQNDFKVIDGKMYGGIGIFDSELKEWVWRWDCGTESAAEAEKGQASDCFKRAGFKFGIGIELYSAPFIWINCETEKNEKGKFIFKDKFEKFDVTEIGYANNGDINKLKIKNKKGEVVFELGKFINNSKKEMEKEKNSDLLQEINPDLDIIEGVRACNTYIDFKNYYKKNFQNVKDKTAFNKIAVEIKEKFGKMEAINIY